MFFNKRYGSVRSEGHEPRGGQGAPGPIHRLLCRGLGGLARGCGIQSSLQVRLHSPKLECDPTLTHEATQGRGIA